MLTSEVNSQLNQHWRTSVWMEWMSKHLGIQLRRTRRAVRALRCFSWICSVGFLFLPLKASDEEEFGWRLGYGGNFGLLRGEVLVARGPLYDRQVCEVGKKAKNLESSACVWTYRALVLIEFHELHVLHAVSPSWPGFRSCKVKYSYFVRHNVNYSVPPSSPGIWTICYLIHTHTGTLQELFFFSSSSKVCYCVQKIPSATA